MFVSPEAKRSGIYLDTLNSKQVVANCVLDLAVGYLKKYGVTDGGFVRECLSMALPHFPENNNIYAYFIYGSIIAGQLHRVLYENNITDLNDINRIPKAVQLQKALIQNEEIIKQLGYQELPERLYNQLLQQHEFKGGKQQGQNINTKEKQNLFIKSF